MAQQTTHVPLGGTGMQVSRFCLGTMVLGAWGESDHEKAISVVHRGLDAGINFIDTADAYSQGESEVIVGKALAGGLRDDVILATKFHGPVDVPITEAGNPNRRGNSRRWMIQAVEDSLRRLQTDWIDLYQVHRPDSATDLEETLAALTDLQQAGKIRAFGSSTFPAHQVVEAQWIAQARGLRRFVSEQPPYSILTRGIEADLLPVAQQFGLAVLPWSPLGGGWLTGRFRDGASEVASDRLTNMPPAPDLLRRYDLTLPDSRRKLEAVRQLDELAREAGIPLIHLALAFVAQHPAVTAPVVGARTVEQLDAQLGALDVTLGSDVLDRIDEIVAPGVTLSRDDLGFAPPALVDARLRREPVVGAAVTRTAP